MKEYDFIAIGDTVTDAFIRLEEISAHVDKDTREICMKFGDKIPYKEVYVIPAVGNSANAAVSAARLGLKSALVSNIGDDYFGKECLNVFKQENVGTEFIKAHRGIKTNYHYVLWYEDDRTILIKHEEYPYELPNIGEPKWVYLSSLGGNSAPWHKKIESYLNEHKNIRLAFQPGTFQIKFGIESLSGLYRRASVFLCNKEEAQRILNTDNGDIKELLKMTKYLGPEIVVITNGVNGAYAHDGDKMWQMPPYPDPKPPLQRTGAGDAFSSTFVATLCLGKDIPDALRLAPINSMSVVQYVGARAGLLTMEKLEDFLKKAPATYFPRRI